jgi:hypothetical protein
VLWFQSSIERLKVSRHLAEEAMDYYEECVSISTMDSTDFSSHDNPHPNSIVSTPAKNNNRFSHKGRSNFQESHTTDQHGLLEVSELISFVPGVLLFQCSHLLCFECLGCWKCITSWSCIEAIVLKCFKYWSTTQNFSGPIENFYILSLSVEEQSKC